MSVRAAQAKVIRGKLRMKAQPHALHIGIAGLRLLTGEGNTAANASPEIDFVVHIDGQSEVAAPIVGQVRQEIWLIG